MKSNFTFRISLLICFSLLSNMGFSGILYVDINATGTNDGTSWTNAFNKLSDALMSASYGDEIWVAEGIYKPELILDLNSDGGSDLREAVFNIPNGVALYGGFAGNEMNREERNWSENITILSGDIDNNDLNGDGNYIAETTDDLVGNNAYHIIYTGNVTSSTRLDGFIVTGGNANISSPADAFDPNLDGGGWYNKISASENSSSPSIFNTSFYGNYASSEGGALYNRGGIEGAENLLHIENCFFSKNKSNNTAGAIYFGSFTPGNYAAKIFNCQFIENESYRRGGAIYMVGDHSEITSSTFLNNKVTAIAADASTLPGSGGAINLVSSNVSITTSQFIGNLSTGNPTGAFEGGGGGAIHISSNEPQTNSLGPSEPIFLSCGFYQNSTSGNTAAWGGAITHLCDGGILRPKYINCVFSENFAQNHGGAVANFVRTFMQPDGYNVILNPLFTNCTFWGNEAGQSGGGIYFQGFTFNGTQLLDAEIENSVLWNNVAGSSGSQIFNSGINSISYSLIQNSGGSGGSWNASLGADAGNNIDNDPEFVNSANPLGDDNIPATSDDGLHLTMSSVAINSGNNSASGLLGISTDYTGENRTASGIVDIGAYERTGIILPDLDIYWLKNWPDFNQPCLSCPTPWSFLLYINNGIKPQFVWKEPAQLVIDDDLATISGEIVNYSAPEITFSVFLKLEKPSDWDSWKKQDGIYFAETIESLITAKKEHVNWKYWTLSKDSYMEGTGTIQGKLLLKTFYFPFKTAFQMGFGANAFDKDYGMGGKFLFVGKLKYKKKIILATGPGSLNVDAKLCTSGCQPDNQGLIAYSGTDLKNNFIPDYKEEINLILYPNPADNFLFVKLNRSFETIADIRIYDLNGRELLTKKIPVDNTEIVIPINDLNPGMYFLKINSPEFSIIKTNKFLKN